jgi:hypothetical protein
MGGTFDLLWPSGKLVNAFYSNAFPQSYHLSVGDLPTTPSLKEPFPNPVPSSDLISPSLSFVADSPRWSPDGSRIAFFYDDECAPGCTRRSLLVVGSDGSDRHTVVGNLQTGGACQGGGIGWSRDGRRLAYAACGSLYIVSIDGGNPTRIAAAIYASW